MKGIRKMDEMELQITLRASRAAWFFLVLALVVWSVWEAFHGGDTTLPAFLLGVSRQTVNAVENDKYGPTLSLGMKLARLLETPVEELFTLDG